MHGRTARTMRAAVSALALAAGLIVGSPPELRAQDAGATPSLDRTRTTGQLQFQLPPGWSRDPRAPGLFRRDDDPSQVFRWHPVQPGDGRALAVQLEARLSKAFQRAVVELRQPVGELKLAGPGLRAVAATRRYRQAGGRVLAFHAFIEAHGSVHLLTASHGSQRGLNALLEDGVEPMVASLRPARVLAAVPPLPDDGATEEQTLGFTLRRPVAWTLREPVGAPASRRTYGARLPLEGKLAVEADVLLEVGIGEVADLEATLAAFVGGPLFDALLSGKVDTLQPYFLRAWVTPDGHRGASLAVTHFRRKRFDAHLAAHAVECDGAVALIGSAMNYDEVPKRLHPKASARFDALRLGMVQAAGSVRLALPPRDPEAEAWLAAKGGYRYRSTRSSGGPATAWLLREVERELTFAADGTCTVRGDTFVGFMSAVHAAGDPGRWIGSDTLTREKSERDGSLRYEVRGAGDGLLLVVRPADGLGALHALERDLETEYGPFKPRGLAIDGLVEGTYEQGSGYKVYEAPGE